MNGELRGYLNIFQKHFRLILLGALVVAIFAIATSYFLPPCYEASVSLYVSRTVEEEAEGYFTYEGFYAQQAAERYTETVVGLLMTEDIMRQALRKVGKPDDPQVVKRILRRVKARRTAPQLVSLKVRQSDAKEVESLLKALSSSAIETANVLNQEGDKGLSISLLEKDPLVKDKSPILWLNGLLGFLSGFFVFTIGFSLVEYFGKEI